MQSTLTSRETDPHDIFAIEPEAVPAARADRAPSDLVHDILSRPSAPQAYAMSAVSAGAPSPSLDTTFRATDVSDIHINDIHVNDIHLPRNRPSTGKWAKRVFMALFALCSAAAAAAWPQYGDEARQMIADWTPSFVLASSPQTEKPALAEQPNSPVVQASSQASTEAAVAGQAGTQPVPSAQPSEGAAPAVASADSTQLLQSMARDLATMGQQIEQLKAGIEQIKAGQDQISRSAARTSEIKASEIRTSETRTSDIRPPEQNLRPKLSALPPRPAVAPLRKPKPAYPPAQAAAAPLPPAIAAPAPLPPEPSTRATTEPADGEPVVRPPMPLR